jgi:hypothetical protein
MKRIIYKNIYFKDINSLIIYNNKLNAKKSKFNTEKVD